MVTINTIAKRINQISSELSQVNDYKAIVIKNKNLLDNLKLPASKYVQIIANKTIEELKTTVVEISDDEIKQFIKLPLNGFIEKIKSKVDDQKAALVNSHAKFLGGRRKHRTRRNKKQRKQRKHRTRKY
jgi:hypothetical protein